MKSEPSPNSVLSVLSCKCVSKPYSYKRVSHAFTLVEILVVITIISLLMGLAVGGLRGVSIASQLTSAGDIILSSFSQAQQIAQSRSRLVEVRFYKHKDQSSLDTGAFFRTVHILEYFEVGDSSPGIDNQNPGIALTKRIAVVQRSEGSLPNGIIMFDKGEMSNLLTDSSIPELKLGDSNSAELYHKVGATLMPYSLPFTAESYRSVVFGPDGPMLPSSKGAPDYQPISWFITVVSASDSDKAASDVNNFFCVQIDPVTGRSASYRP